MLIIIVVRGTCSKLISNAILINEQYKQFNFLVSKESKPSIINMSRLLINSFIRITSDNEIIVAILILAELMKVY
jgi:hypothetical protein